jgi:methylated-DNA-protein-cysteine methyltransferase-like protein
MPNKPAARPAPTPLTEAYARIWAVIKRVPKGRVATYGQIATEAGFAKRPRLTAQALRHAPEKLKLPWFRIINAQGRIAIPKGSAGHDEQRERLEAEGVAFIRDRVDLDVYRWQPRSFAPLVD